MSTELIEKLLPAVITAIGAIFAAVIQARAKNGKPKRRRRR